jgi:hypothetical protein
MPMLTSRTRARIRIRKSPHARMRTHADLYDVHCAQHLLAVVYTHAVLWGQAEGVPPSEACNEACYEGGPPAEACYKA